MLEWALVQEGLKGRPLETRARRRVPWLLGLHVVASAVEILVAAYGSLLLTTHTELCSHWGSRPLAVALVRTSWGLIAFNTESGIMAVFRLMRCQTGLLTQDNVQEDKDPALRRIALFFSSLFQHVDVTVSDIATAMVLVKASQEMRRKKALRAAMVAAAEEEAARAEAAAEELEGVPACVGTAYSTDDVAASPFLAFQWQPQAVSSQALSSGVDGVAYFRLRPSGPALGGKKLAPPPTEAAAPAAVAVAAPPDDATPEAEDDDSFSSPYLPLPPDPSLLRRMRSPSLSSPKEEAQPAQKPAAVGGAEVTEAFGFFGSEVLGGAQEDGAIRTSGGLLVSLTSAVSADVEEAEASGGATSDQAPSSCLSIQIPGTPQQLTLAYALGGGAAGSSNSLFQLDVCSGPLSVASVLGASLLHSGPMPPTSTVVPITSAVPVSTTDAPSAFASATAAASAATASDDDEGDDDLFASPYLPLPPDVTRVQLMLLQVSSAMADCAAAARALDGCKLAGTQRATTDLGGGAGPSLSAPAAGQTAKAPDGSAGPEAPETAAGGAAHMLMSSPSAPLMPQAALPSPNPFARCWTAPSRLPHELSPMQPTGSGECLSDEEKLLCPPSLSLRLSTMRSLEEAPTGSTAALPLDTGFGGEGDDFALPPTFSRLHSLVHLTPAGVEKHIEDLAQELAAEAEAEAEAETDLFHTDSDDEPLRWAVSAAPSARVSSNGGGAAGGGVSEATGEGAQPAAPPARGLLSRCGSSRLSRLSDMASSLRRYGAEDAAAAASEEAPQQAAAPGRGLLSRCGSSRLSRMSDMASFRRQGADDSAAGVGGGAQPAPALTRGLASRPGSLPRARWSEMGGSFRRPGTDDGTGSVLGMPAPGMMSRSTSLRRARWSEMGGSFRRNGADDTGAAALRQRITDKALATAFGGARATVDRSTLEEARVYGRYSAATYGGYDPHTGVPGGTYKDWQPTWWDRLMGRGPASAEEGMRQAMKDSMLKLTPYVVHVNTENSTEGFLPFAVCLDEATRSVVISIRGTASLEDIITDVLLAPYDVRELLPPGLLPARAAKDEEEEPVLVHGGFWGASEAILVNLKRLGLLELLFPAPPGRATDTCCSSTQTDPPAAAAGTTSFMGSAAPASASTHRTGRQREATGAEPEAGTPSDPSRVPPSPPALDPAEATQQNEDSTPSSQPLPLPGKHQQGAAASNGPGSGSDRATAREGRGGRGSSRRLALLSRMPRLVSAPATRRGSGSGWLDAPARLLSLMGGHRPRTESGGESGPAADGTAQEAGSWSRAVRQVSVLLCAASAWLHPGPKPSSVHSSPGSSGTAAADSGEPQEGACEDGLAGAQGLVRGDSSQLAEEAGDGGGSHPTKRLQRSNSRSLVRRGSRPDLSRWGQAPPASLASAGPNSASNAQPTAQPDGGASSGVKRLMITLPLPLPTRDSPAVASGGGARPWRLVVTGHSMGGGVAALLAMRLRAALPHVEVKAWCFGPPGALASPELCAAMEPFCVSVVAGKDLVPRMSPHTMERYRDEMMTALARCSCSKAEVLLGTYRKANRTSWVNRLLLPFEDMPQEAAEALWRYHRAVQEADRLPEMHAPGKVLYLQPSAAPVARPEPTLSRSNSGTLEPSSSPRSLMRQATLSSLRLPLSSSAAPASAPAAASKPPKVELRYRPVWVTAAELSAEGILASSRMLTDHNLLNACLPALDSLLKPVEQQGMASNGCGV
ncbi:hypothetical protein HYH03_002355 [Edaphochlamys debaryana]|uniref:sn-1-specific diacylglycerol lipase n=1 Tax=Edaphochlamys debaryana TaxID=47281 RepID=A0A835YF49_9CHLO|nr:hypothetical protein HYH03_002355 [Edaphochlamys debaryana]|eukprot:KAG2500078.1 hypothetical protein HYH03_002355 [Edaphochlamys debaryana]